MADTRRSAWWQVCGCTRDSTPDKPCPKWWLRSGNGLISLRHEEQHCWIGKNWSVSGDFSATLYSSDSSRPSSFSYGNGRASFPQTSRYARKCSAACKSTIRKCFLIQTPCLMCTAGGTTVDEADVCHLGKRVVFGLHHKSNTRNHFNCSELSTSSDCLYSAVVCSRDTAYATHWIRVIAYPSVR
jgi:hypothetical protein